MIAASDIAGLLRGVDVIRAGEGPGVALAHGAGGGVHENFDGLIARLSGHRTVIGANYPGSGASATIEGGLSTQVLADQLVAAAVQAGLERFPVAGLSFGCAVAVTAAVRHPEHVTGLALTVGYPVADTQVRCFAQVWEALHTRGDWDALGAYMLQLAGTTTELARLDEDGRLAAVADNVARYPRDGDKHARAAARADVRELLPHVRVPTTVYVGAQDRVVLPSSTRALAAGIRGARLVEYADAGHIFTPEQDAVWAADISDYLDAQGL